MKKEAYGSSEGSEEYEAMRSLNNDSLMMMELFFQLSLIPPQIFQLGKIFCSNKVAILIIIMSESVGAWKIYVHSLECAIYYMLALC